MTAAPPLPPLTVTPRDAKPAYPPTPLTAHSERSHEDVGKHGDVGKHEDFGKHGEGEREKVNGEGEGAVRITIPGTPVVLLPPSPPPTLPGDATHAASHPPHPPLPPPQLQTQTHTQGEEDEGAVVGETQQQGGEEGEGQEDEEVDIGTYDPYDLGYSPETPIGPSLLRPAPSHPLLPAPAPPTPPLWETIPPPPRSTRPLVPRSAYYFGPPPADAAYGSAPAGHIGVHHPRELVRVERDYASGELPQFAATYPLELEGRITPTQFLDTVNTINEHLIAAYSLRRAFIDNALSFLTLQLSRLVLRPHYEQEMERLREAIEELNVKVYNPVGLNILWPRKVAFMFLEIEYY